MPSLDTNKNEDLFHYHQVKSPDQIERSLVHQPATHYHLKANTSPGAMVDTLQVDLSNESILTMVVYFWGLNPSLANLRVKNENVHFSDNDMLDLLSVIIPRR